MKRQATVYLICGFIGAGKTTFAKMLEKKTGAVRIVKDEWSIRLIGNDPTIDGYAEWDRKIIDLSRDVAFYLAEKGIDVIMDEGFWEKETRDEMRRRADAIGAKVGDLATDGLQIPAVTMTNAPLKPVEGENRPMF